MPSSARQRQEVVSSLGDPFARDSLRVAYHVRRYALLYVSGIIGVLALGIFPVFNASSSTLARSPSGAGSVSAGGNGSSTNGSGPGGTVPSGSGPSLSGGGAAGTVAGGAPGGGGTAVGPSTAGGPTTGAGNGSGPVGTVQSGAGTTVAGIPCRPGVRQIPFSTYADQCVAKFSGSNGGAITRGVTARTITIGVRETADAQGANALAAQAEGEAAGGVSNQTNWSYMQSVVSWMNKQFELYGRQVKLQLFQGQGNQTNEELDQGQAQACADADTEANSINAFGGFNYLGIFETGVFSDCAARYHLYIPEGAAYFPESWYAQRSPYIWGITMNCSLIAQEVGEWVGKQIGPYPSKWAGNDGVLSLNGRQRKFGTYVPNNAEYQQCVQTYLGVEENQYHIAKTREDQYNYALDIATFPQDAQKAIIQFAANDDTTLVLACDPISPIFMTQDAVQQNYYPEWQLIGVAGTDTDNFAQLWDQKAITGHLFGLSQLASTSAILSPSSEDGQALKAAGVPLNISSAADYFDLLSMFNQLQAAGPDLTATNIAARTPDIPPGTGPFGGWNFGNTHTAVIDSRQIYWDASAKSPANGKTGTYIQVYNGARFGRGQFPTGDAPYYP